MSMDNFLVRESVGISFSFETNLASRHCAQCGFNIYYNNATVHNNVVQYYKIEWVILPC